MILTVNDAHVGPGVFSLTDHACAPADERSTDNGRDLQGVRVLDAPINENASSNTIDRGREDNISSDIS
jgi:hypothetical protein